MVTTIKNKKCAFTGHRPQSLPFGFNEGDGRCIALKQTLQDEIIQLIESGTTYFISGMALGIDMFTAEIILSLKSHYSDLILEAAIPCLTQADRWPSQLQERYLAILSGCDRKVLIQRQYTPDCMRRRNQYMVNQADIVLAVWDGRPSGTGQTVQYAQRQGKIIRIINPKTILKEKK